MKQNLAEDDRGKSKLNHNPSIQDAKETTMAQCNVHNLIVSISQKVSTLKTLNPSRGFWLITSEVESFSARNFVTFPNIECRNRKKENFSKFVSWVA